MANFPARAIHLKIVSSMKDNYKIIKQKLFGGSEKTTTLKPIITDKRKYWIYKTKTGFCKKKKNEWRTLIKIKGALKH